jgi:hypothetical protein
MNFNIFFVFVLFSLLLGEIQCGALGGWKEIDDPYLDVEISNIGRYLILNFNNYIYNNQFIYCILIFF